MTRDKIKRELERFHAIPAIQWSSDGARLLDLCNALAAELEAVEARQSCSVVDEREARLKAFNTIMSDSTMPDDGAPDYDNWLFDKSWNAALAYARATQSEAKPELGKVNLVGLREAGCDITIYDDGKKKHSSFEACLRFEQNGLNIECYGYGCNEAEARSDLEERLEQS